MITIMMRAVTKLISFKMFSTLINKEVTITSKLEKSRCGLDVSNSILCSSSGEMINKLPCANPKS